MPIKKLDNYLRSQFGYCIYNFVYCFTFIYFGWIWRHIDYYDTNQKKWLRYKSKDYDKEINTYNKIKKDLIKTLKPFHLKDMSIPKMLGYVLKYGKRKGIKLTDKEMLEYYNYLRGVDDKAVIDFYNLNSFFKNLEDRIKIIEDLKTELREIEAELIGAPIKPINKIASVYATIMMEKQSPCIEDISFVIEWINNKFKNTLAYIQLSSGDEIYSDTLRREISRIKGNRKNIPHIKIAKKSTFPKNKKLDLMAALLHYEKDSFYILPATSTEGKDIFENPHSVNLIHFPDGTEYSLGDYLE